MFEYNAIKWPLYFYFKKDDSYEEANYSYFMFSSFMFSKVDD